MASNHPLEKMVARLSSRTELSAADRAAILALPHHLRTVEPAAYLVRMGERRRTCPVLLDGLAFRQKTTSEGARQIVSLQVPGDLIDLPNLFLNQSDHNVQVLTRATIAEIPIPALQELALNHPAIARAMWIDALVDASIAREWIVNVGRRDARSAIAHVLCEFGMRLRNAGLAEDGVYELPMNQEQLGDVVGLTPVHVNRTLKALAAEGLIRRDKRHIAVVDWEALRSVGDFSTLYLHLDQGQTAS
jgi:CRP-like cAMP-binding protein